MSVPWSGWREWGDATSNINDVERVIQLGMKAYHDFYGKGARDLDAKIDVETFAELLHPAFTHMDETTLRELRENLKWTGRFFEPGLWESPAHTTSAHQLVEEQIRNNESPTLIELLLIAHDLEYFIRPNLLRLLWVAKRTDPGCRTSYTASQLKSGDEQGSLWFALKGLTDWVDSPASSFLDDGHREALRELARSFKSDEPDHISLHSLRNWVDHRDFLISADAVVLNFHPAPGRRLRVERPRVTVMRRQLLGLSSLMYAFQTMFHAHDVARGQVEV